MDNNSIVKSGPSFNVREMLDVSVVHQRELRESETRRVDELAILREKHIADKFRDENEKYQIQFSAAKEALGIALVAQEKSTAQALDGTKEAIVKNDANTDKRFDLLSEKIDSIASTISKNTGAQGIYVTHTDLNTAMDKLQTSIESTLRPVVNFMNAQGGRSSGQQNMFGWIVAGIATLISIAVFFYQHIK